MISKVRKVLEWLYHSQVVIRKSDIFRQKKFFVLIRE